MPDDVVLSVRNVSKKFCRNLRRSMAYGIKDLACNLGGIRQETSGLRRDEFWALSEINLELRKSEFLGIIGANGSGKSTLLRLIHGIFPPDKGEIVARGRVGALIALGAGFHPHMTGRENIYLNGAILGMSRKFIDSRLARIVDFAEIGDFLEAPVSTYSSGMRVRLGFSIAAHMSPDLLLVDEVLSVGDSSFRERCYNHMIEYKENGGTVIFISHNTLAVEQVCDRVVWLDRGCVMAAGEPSQTIERYEQSMQEISLRAANRELVRSEPADGGEIRITKIEIQGRTGQPTDEVAFMEPFSVCIHYVAEQDVESPRFAIGLRKGFNTAHPCVASMRMTWDGIQMGTLPREGVVTCAVESPMLSPGAYTVRLCFQRTLSGQVGKKHWIPPHDFASFTILPGELRRRHPEMPALHLVGVDSALIMDHHWMLNGETLATGTSEGAS